MLLFISTATLVAVYWFWIRAIPKSRPAFREVYQEEESFLAAVRERNRERLRLRRGRRRRELDRGPSAVLGLAADPDRRDGHHEVFPRPGRQSARN
jgi:hypothetical protein